MSDFAVAEQGSAAAPQRAEPGPLPKRIVETFVSPGALFSRFGEKAPWWDVLLVALAVTAVSLFLIPVSVYQAALEQQAANNPNIDAAAMAEMTKIGGTVVNVVMLAILVFIMAGVLTVAFRFLMGGEATFRQYLGVVSHAMLIGAVGAAVTAALVTAKGDATVRLSIGLLTPFLDPASFPYRVLNGLTVFNLWQTAVLATGVSALNRRISWGAAAAVLFVLLLAWAMFGAVIAGAAGAGG